MRHPAWIAAFTAVLLFVLGLAPVQAASPPGGAAGPSLGWTVEAAPFRLGFVRDGRPLLAQASGARNDVAGRMSYGLADGTTHQVTDLRKQQRVSGGTQYTVGTDEPGRTASVTVRRTPRGLRIGWTFTPATGVARVHEALSGSAVSPRPTSPDRPPGDDEHFLGGGANALFVDLRHRIVLDKVLFAGAGQFDSCTKTSAAGPFFLSSRGYAVFPDTTAIGRLAFPNAADSPPDCGGADPPPCPVLTGVPDRTQLCFKTDHLDYEVYAGSPAEVVRSYSAHAGRPALPPPSQFGLMKWRDTVHGTAEVVEDVDQFERLGIPLETVWIDNPWELENAPPDQVGAGTSCMGTLTFDPPMFPDPKGMIDYVHAHDAHLGLWISPYVSVAANNQPCPPNDFPPGSLIPAPGDPNRMLVDYTDPAGRALWESKLEKVLSLGVDMVKGDRGDGERDVEKSTFQAGPGALVANTYPVLYERSTQRVMSKLFGNDYTQVFRGGFTGAPAALHGFWQGDQQMTFEALRSTVRRGQSAWLSGHPVWGSDTGGYTTGGNPALPSPSLFVRWAQLSAVSPVFEVGGGGLNATPWRYDQATVDRLRDNAILHYELFPYLYGLAKESARTGVPITRPLGFEYPGDAQAWQAEQEFLVGPSLLAAMVTSDRAEQDGAAGQPTPVDVYLPAGRWIDLHSGEVLDGGRHVTRQSTLDDFPLFLKAGSAIGFNARASGLFDRNDLGTADRAGWLYAPPEGPAEGTTEADSPYGGHLTATRHGNKVTIELRGAPAQTTILIAGRKAKPALVKLHSRDGRAVTTLTLG
jgi:alpha-D-xyloside xylohydrolase